MPDCTITMNISGQGESVNNQSVTRSADGGNTRKPTVPKGFAGALTTRTDANTGIVTLGDGHGIVTSDKVDIYWAGGCQHGVTVGTVSGNSVPIDLGTGDNLPVATTPVVVSKRIQVNFPIDLTTLLLLWIFSFRNALGETAKSRIEFQASDNTVLLGQLVEEKGPLLWDLQGQDVTPFSGDGPATKAFVSNGSSTSDATMTIQWLQDATP